MTLNESLKKFQDAADKLKKAIPMGTKIGRSEAHDLIDALRVVEQVQGHLNLAIRQSVARWLSNE